MPRFHLPKIEELTTEQKDFYDGVVSGPRGRLVGPLRAVIHSPELANRWSKMGEYLRYNTSLPDSLNELAIIVAGRHWNSQLEFHIHALAAKKAGLADDIIEAIRTAQSPTFKDPAELEVYNYARMMLATGNLTDEVHNAIVKRWGEKGAVELTGVIGYYTMVSFTLNAHEIPMIDDAPHPLDVKGSGPTLMPEGVLIEG